MAKGWIARRMRGGDGGLVATWVQIAQCRAVNGSGTAVAVGQVGGTQVALIWH